VPAVEQHYTPAARAGTSDVAALTVAATARDRNRQCRNHCDTAQHIRQWDSTRRHSMHL
jgi:hypothetical protein